MTASVATPTRDRPGILGPCVDALVRLGTAEVVVVDSASADFEAAVAPAVAAGLRVVRCDRPGASIARNAGLRATTAPIVAFTDDDCRPLEDWIDRITAPFEDPSVGFVTGRVEPDRHEGPVVSVLQDDRARRFDHLADPAGMGHAANIAVRRDAFESVGGFDEAMGPGTALCAGEDHDLIWRLLRAGWVGAYAPDAVVVHHQWRGRAAALKVEYQYGLGSGAFASKARRIDPSAAAGLLKHRLWDEGIVAAAGNARRGHRRATLGAALRTLGTVVGLIRAARMPLAGERYASGGAPGSPHQRPQ